MKIALSQQNYILGDFEHNSSKIQAEIEKAIKHNVELIVFSELCLTGYPPTDFFYFQDYYEKIDRVLDSLLPMSKEIGILIGAPRKNTMPEGKDYFNSVYFI